MSANELILLTGGNGFVGYGVLCHALKAGYHVRAVVRRQNAMDKIKKGPSMQPYLSSGALTFIVVSDFNKPDAFIEPAKGCDYIVHVASPLPTLVDEDLVEPALAATRAIIAAAEATPSVKRIVTTSSTSGIRLFGRELKDDPVNIAIATGKDEHIPPLTADTQVPTQPPLPAGAAPTERYNASKIAAINWLREYNATRKSATFSIINIMPGWVLGPEELTFSKADALQGSNYVLAWLFQDFSLAPLMGLPEGTDTPLLAETVHLDDVAEGHVKALNIEKVPGQFRNFLLSSNSPSGPVLMDAVNIVKRNLPKEVAEGKIPFTGRMGTIKNKYDATITESELLGRPFVPFDKQVIDTVKWFVDL